MNFKKIGTQALNMENEVDWKKDEIKEKIIEDSVLD